MIFRRKKKLASINFECFFSPPNHRERQDNKFISFLRHRFIEEAGQTSSSDKLVESSGKSRRRRKEKIVQSIWRSKRIRMRTKSIEVSSISSKRKRLERKEKTNLIFEVKWNVFVFIEIFSWWKTAPVDSVVCRVRLETTINVRSPWWKSAICPRSENC